MSSYLMRASALLALAFLTGAGAAGSAPAKPASSSPAKVEKAVQAPEMPKLVLVLMVDGLPHDQWIKYRDQYGKGGFRRFLDEGAWFTDAHQAHAVTFTGVGHAAVLTGAHPYRHGIISNTWLDRATLNPVYCTEDRAHTYLGDKTKPDDGTSPKLLQVTTLGDELRYKTGNAAKVVAISGKDRGAILLAGKTGTAYMYMQGGRFASSTYYMKEHPAWVEQFNATKPAAAYVGRTWKPLLPAAAYRADTQQGDLPKTLGTPGGPADAAYLSALSATPFLDEMTLNFARAALDGEQLGRNPAGVPDLLAVSLSTHDYINHAAGPESLISHDHLLQLDRLVADFLSDVDKRVGLANTLVVFTADHGFANTPEFYRANGVEASRIDSRRLVEAANAQLAEKFGVKKLIGKASSTSLYFDQAALDGKGLVRADVEREAVRALLAEPGVVDVYTRTQLETGQVPPTRLGHYMQRAFNRQLSGDLHVVLHAGDIAAGAMGRGTTHGSPYIYDTNVPLVLMGRKWIKPGKTGTYAEVQDIAPTLSHVLETRQPSGAEGRVLTEVLR